MHKAKDCRCDCPIEPLQNYVVLARAEAPAKVGAILMPAVTRENEKPHRGTVLAVGPGRVPQTGGEAVEIRGLAVGDEVYFAPYGGKEVDVDGRKFFVVAADDLIARVKKG